MRRSRVLIHTAAFLCAFASGLAGLEAGLSLAAPPPPVAGTVLLGSAASAAKTDLLAVDVDSDGRVDPGDTIEYSILVANSGDEETSPMVFTDTPGANSRLVVGSVGASLGTVTRGNGVGDTQVQVDLPTIVDLDGSATITFRVTVNKPFPIGAVQVANQGLLTGTSIADTPTDDPDLPGLQDPTITPIAAAPVIQASKTDALVLDRDHDGRADPRDRLRYTISIVNIGDQDATATLFRDIPDANTTLVVGSVTTSAPSRLD